MSKNVVDFVKSIRVEFHADSIDTAIVSKDPIEEFKKWISEAIEHKIPEPNAMNLATAGNGKRVSSRIVLLRGFDKNGFVFFTNYNSKKGTDLTKNNFAALNFFWAKLHKQVRIEGRVFKTSEKVSDDYFNERPLESRLGAWASEQSSVIENRAVLENNVKEYSKKFGKKVPRPKHWGGFVLKPDYLEFWNGRTSRLHDRIAFKLVKNKWKISRLAP